MILSLKCGTEKVFKDYSDRKRLQKRATKEKFPLGCLPPRDFMMDQSIIIDADFNASRDWNKHRPSFNLHGLKYFLKKTSILH